MDKTKNIKQARAFVKQWLNRLSKQPFVCQHSFSQETPVNGRRKTVGCALSCALSYKEMVKHSKKDRISMRVEEKLKKVFKGINPTGMIAYDIDLAIPEAIDTANPNVSVYNKKEDNFVCGLSGPRAANITKKKLREIFNSYLPKSITKELLA